MRNWLSPVFAWRPSCRKAFSTTTTEPSTIRPMAMARPPSDIRLAEMPSLFIAMKVSKRRQHQRRHDDQRGAHVAEEQEQHDDDQHDAFEQHLGHGPQRRIDQFRTVVVGNDLQAVGQHALGVDLVDPRLDLG